MSSIYIIHASDQTTDFLSIFEGHFSDNFYKIEPNSESVKESFSFFEQAPDGSLIVFLGHGHSTGLYTPESESFEKKIFIDVDLANKFFKNKIVILLTCNSNQFIKKITNYKYIIGFGNILSSMKEVLVEAELETGIYRNLSEEDIKYFNQSYCHAIICALKKHQDTIYKYTDLPKLIEFYINQRINEILLKKEVTNRTEIAKLLFKFRDEMDYYYRFVN